LVLVAQALLFWLPSCIWRIMYKKSGLDIKSILNAAGKQRKELASEGREGNAKKLGTHIEEVMNIKRQLFEQRGTKHRLPGTGSYGRYLLILYMITKMAYIVNVVVQFFIMNAFLGLGHFWGLQILSDLAHGRQWQDTRHFPRVTMCEFKVRDEIGFNMHNWTIQCVLMINMFTEKFYIFLWWWFIFVGVITSLNFVYWILISFAGSSRQFIERYLRVRKCIGETSSRDETARTTKFINSVVRPDGILLLRLVQINAGDLLTGDVVAQMWEHYITASSQDSSGYTEQTPDH